MGSSTIPAAGGVAQVGTLYEQIFTSSGTWTYPSSPNFNGQVEVLCVGGGGSGGNAIDASGTAGFYVATGGGGGGQVTQRTISVLNGGNQSVVVGAGGAGFTTNNLFYASAGGYSSFGTATYANNYPDPGTAWGLWRVSAAQQALPEFDQTSTISVQNPVASDGVVSPLLGGWMTQANLSASGTNSIYSNYFPVTASVSHRFGFSYAFYTGNLNAQVVQCRVYYYSATGASTGSSTFTTYTIPTASSSSWTPMTLTATPPAGSVAARFSWTSTNAISGNHYLCGLFSNLASTSVTTAVAGFTAGYEWLGVPYQSSTVVANDTDFVYANGGGGGWSVCIGTTVTTVTQYPGQPGFSAGGRATYGGSAPNIGSPWYIGGCGGGALTSATSLLAPLTYLSVSGGNGTQTLGITDNQYVQYPAAARPQNNIRYTTRYGSGGGDGGQAVTLSFSSAANMTSVTSWGGNGSGVNVTGFGGYGSYGYGGCGGYAVGDTNVVPLFTRTGRAAVAPVSTYSPRAVGTVDPYVDGLENTGNGGAGVYTAFATNARGGNGGSGVVIVRWYA